MTELSERILVVEDSRTQAEALRAHLQREGFRVEVALTGEAALERLPEGFDVVLSDVLMPGMSGYELCRRVKRGPQGVKPPLVILLTSLRDPTHIVRGLEAGADNYVTKPYEPERLAERIRHVLDSREQRGEGHEQGAIPVRFLGERFLIDAGRGQILDLLLSSFHDLARINERLQASERALADTVRSERAARTAAEDATRARDEVMAMVSHDLRNPLSGLFATADVLLEVIGEDEISARALDKIRMIRRFAGQMDRLIQDLLDVTSIEAGRLAFERGPHHVEPLLHEALEMLRPRAQEKSQEIRVRSPQGVPPVDADPARIIQVLSNLLANAVKFSPESTAIDVGAEPADQQVRFFVRDRGPGIPVEERTRIFDRFWQARREAGGGGAGLGLTIARGIVQAHGGSIWVDSEPDRGSTFHFTVPAAEVACPKE